MQQPKEELIKIAIEKSFKVLKTAQDNMDIDNLEIALNRAYYAIFYSVMALAYKYDFATSKHSKLMGWFNKKFIYEDKIFNSEMFKVYEEAFLYRQKSDYDLMYIPNKDLVDNLLQEVKVFIEKIKEII